MPDDRPILDYEQPAPKPDALKRIVRIGTVIVIAIFVLGTLLPWIISIFRFWQWE